MSDEQRMNLDSQEPDDEDEVIEMASVETNEVKNLAVAQARLIGDL